MAITIDQAQVGVPVSVATGVATIAITTNVTVASNGLIVIAAASDNPATLLSSVSGGGLTWTVDKSAASTVSLDVVGLASAPAVAGLASGTTITATFDLAGTSKMIGGLSLVGADLTASRVDGTPNANDTSGTSWTTLSYTIAAGSVLVAGAEYDLNRSATATSPSIKAWEVLEATGGNALAQAYRIEPSAGSYVVAGTWVSGLAGSGQENIAVAYKAAAAAGGSPQQTLIGVGA